MAGRTFAIGDIFQRAEHAQRLTVCIAQHLGVDTHLADFGVGQHDAEVQVPGGACFHRLVHKIGPQRGWPECVALTIGCIALAEALGRAWAWAKARVGSEAAGAPVPEP